MQLNMEKCSALITSKVHTHSFLGYKTYVKQKAIDLYSDHCTILQCYVCQNVCEHRQFFIQLVDIILL